MGEIQELTGFFMAIREDHRIGISHISLYMSLLQLYNLNQRRNPVPITRRAVMAMAKISGIATYHRCMKDLDSFGYVRYHPSFNPAISSVVELVAVGGPNEQKSTSE